MLLAGVAASHDVTLIPIPEVLPGMQVQMAIEARGHDRLQLNGLNTAVAVVDALVLDCNVGSAVGHFGEDSTFQGNRNRNERSTSVLDC